MQISPIANLSLPQLKQVVSIREKIDGLEKELSRILNGQSSTIRTADRPRRKRRLSAAGRAKLSATMKARWAKRRKRKSLRTAKAAVSVRRKGTSQRGQ